VIDDQRLTYAQESVGTFPARIDASDSKHGMAKTIEQPLKHLKAMSHALSENDPK
jgi:hypothetical protein